MHPNIGIGLANYFSRKSRMANAQADEVFLGENEEWLVQFCKDYLSKNPPVDYFVFGHRHLPLDIRLEKGARYINLGEWVKYNSYAVFDGKQLELKFFETNMIR
jgi:UDP-2,3-diacylglucosamine hydrolase